MSRVPSPPRDHRRRSRYWLMAACALIALAIGIGMAVRAGYESPPAVKPYDPLQNW